MIGNDGGPCVRRRAGQWCAIATDMTSCDWCNDPHDGKSVKTMCGSRIRQPWVVPRRAPNCPDCLEALLG